MTFLTPFVCAVLTVQVAQVPPPRPASAISVEEATTITQGWAFLAQGDLASAVEKATAALAASPRSPAALALAVEVEITRGGASTGLDFYEQWLRSRALEEPIIVRRVALALLREIGSDTQNPTLRADALTALAEHGDPWALTQLANLAEAGGRAEELALAGLGGIDPGRAIEKELRSAPVPSAAGIRALSRGKQPFAVAAVLPFLRSPRPDIRAETIAALGELDARAEIPGLKVLLQDPVYHVRLAAASTLLRLGSDSGLSLIDEAARSDSEDTRLAAASALSHWPGGRSAELASGLISAREPAVRIQAALLLAKSDRAAAAGTIEALLTTENAAVRELAFRAWADIQVESAGVRSMLDLRPIREKLRARDRFARFFAAKVILTITD